MDDLNIQSEQIENSSVKEDTNPETDKKNTNKKKNIIGIIVGVIVSVLVIGAAIFGITFYFKNYYLNKDQKAAVEGTINAISYLGTVSTNSGESILAAELSFAKLDAKSQRFVTNVEELKKARNEYNKLRANEVIEEIKSIGDVEWEDGSIIAEARSDYDVLNDTQKKLVTNIDLLIDSESEYGIIESDIRDAKEVLENFLQAYSEGDLDGMFTYSDISETSGSDEALVFLLTLGTQAMLSEIGIDYSSLSYSSQEKMDEFTTAILEAYIRENMLSYEIGDPSYSTDTISFEVVYENSNAAEDMSSDLSDLIAVDAYLYLMANQSTLKLMAWGLSDDELKNFMMDQLILDSSDSWIDYVRSLDLSEGKKSKKTVYHVDRQ
ncbi:MAG: hypothetical protein K6A72_02030 [Lachnospiraceae bacterium]|nr:hypothetical protein [Lachnospiraceae bacterium]